MNSVRDRFGSPLPFRGGAGGGAVQRSSRLQIGPTPTPPLKGRGFISILALALLLPGCGLRPLYAGGGSGQVARALGNVEVAPMPGRAGWLLRTALVDRLGSGSGAPTYRLVVELDDQITGFGIRGDNAVTRERRSLRARYRLVDAAKGTVLLDQTAGSDAGIDVVSSEYATVATEQTAIERLSAEVADQIVTRIALYASRAGKPAP